VAARWCGTDVAAPIVVDEAGDLFVTGYTGGRQL
jgi:hypothetical protein